MPLFDGSRPGPGRPKGSLTRWSRSSLDAVFKVFENLGGVEAMTEWARAHPSDFYRGIYARLLPTKTEVDLQVESPRKVHEFSDAELLAFLHDHADGQRIAAQDGAGEAQDVPATLIPHDRHRAAHRP